LRAAGAELIARGQSDGRLKRRSGRAAGGLHANYRHSVDYGKTGEQ